MSICGYSGGCCGAPERVFAYISTPSQTTMTTAEEWYFFESIFTNVLVSNFTVGASGITYTGDGDAFEIEWRFCGEAGETSEIYAAIVKNATFDENGMMTDGTICAGSCGGSQSITQGLATAFVSPHSLCAMEIATGDTVALVVSSSTSANSVIPESGCASIHKFS